VTEQNSEISVRELVDKLYGATQRMSRKNGHRVLMLHAMSAIMQLSKRIDAIKEAELLAEKPEAPRVELVTF